MYDIKKIGKKGFEFKTTMDFAIPKAFAAGDRAVVDFSGRLTQVDKFRYILEGESCGLLATPCSLCLKNSESPVKFEVVEVFVQAGSGEICEDEVAFEDDYINISPVLQRNLFNNIPMRFVCNSDCKGLCARCGYDLNIGQCECLPEGRAEFAELIGLFD